MRAIHRASSAYHGDGIVRLRVRRRVGDADAHHHGWTAKQHAKWLRGKGVVGATQFCVELDAHVCPVLRVPLCAPPSQVWADEFAKTDDRVRWQGFLRTRTLLPFTTMHWVMMPDLTSPHRLMSPGRSPTTRVLPQFTDTIHRAAAAASSSTKRLQFVTVKSRAIVRFDADDEARFRSELLHALSHSAAQRLLSAVMSHGVVDDRFADAAVDLDACVVELFVQPLADGADHLVIASASSTTMSVGLETRD